MRHIILPAIMSGGTGARLWPASTARTPKQFLAVGAAQSLMTRTAARVRGDHGDISFAAPLVLCSAAHAGMVRAHLEAGGSAPRAIVREPMGRNTAAAAAVAAQFAIEIGPDALVLLLPSDQVVADEAAFRAAIARAAPFAAQRIVAFGVKPDRPAEGYGYIKRGETLAEGVFAIERFTEKPNAASAQSYLAGADHYWNAGIFLFSPRVMLEEFAAHAPDIRDGALAALAAAKREGDVISLDAALFAQVREEAVDRAVMEKTRRAAVVPCDMGWADVGAWDEVWRLAEKDGAGNFVSGPAALLDGSGNLVRSEGPKLIVAGVDDLIVVATREAVIVLPRARAQEVKALRERAERLTSEGGSQNGAPLPPGGGRVGRG